MNPNTNLPEAQVSPKRQLSAVWLVPVLALAIGLWMVFQQWYQKGPTITIQFESATGLDKGKTKIKTRDLTIGLVTDIRLTDAQDGVLVTAEINKSAESLLKDDTKFWVVSPRITRSGVSGLNTLLSGAYIQLAPGSGTSTAKHYQGLEEPPVTPAGTPGKHIVLTSLDRFEYSVGDPVVYKGLTVGQFEEVRFDIDKQQVFYDVFIEAPYHQLITPNTRFWNASGVSFKLGADGIDVRTSSLASLLSNSVSFGEVDKLAQSHSRQPVSNYRIYKSIEAANAPNFEYKAEYVVLVSDSVRGLSEGAPVEYRGIAIGEVLDVNFRPNIDEGTLLQQDYKIPVLIAIYPGRVGLPDSAEGRSQIQAQNSLWISQGLKAQLRTGNLITGQLYVQLQHDIDAPVDNIANYASYTVIPSTPDDLTQFTHQAGELLDKFNDLPLEGIADNANELLENLSITVNTLNGAGESLQTMLADVNQQALVEQLNQAVSSVAHLADSYSEGSQGHDELISTIDSLNQRLLDLKPLLRTLNEKPNSLVFSGSRGSDREPKAQ